MSDEHDDETTERTCPTCGLVYRESEPLSSSTWWARTCPRCQSKEPVS